MRRYMPQQRRGACLVVSGVMHAAVVAIAIAAISDTGVRPSPVHRSVSIVAPHKPALMVRRKLLRSPPPIGNRRSLLQLASTRPVVQLTAIPDAPELAP